jgi:hypothetical protein
VFGGLRIAVGKFERGEKREVEEVYNVWRCVSSLQVLLR